MSRHLLKFILAGKISRQQFVEDSIPIQWDKIVHIGEERTIQIINSKGLDKSFTFDEYEQVKDLYESHFEGQPIEIIFPHEELARQIYDDYEKNK